MYAKGLAFENLTARVIQRSLGILTIQSGRAGDGGVDLKAIFLSRNLMIQCKDHSSSTKPITIRELEGTIRDGDIGMLCTTSKWSDLAIRRLQTSPCYLIGAVIENEDLISLFLSYKAQQELRLGVAKSFEGLVSLVMYPQI